MNARRHLYGPHVCIHDWHTDWEDEELPRNVVNLDALLPRLDLSAPADGSPDLGGIKLADLAPGLIYPMLRKPDFQRETANWGPEQIADLVITFVNGNIIPAIILWQSGNRVFVIDGAHRLSALIAWVNDDYGTGKTSIAHYRNVIPDYQREMHDVARKLIHTKIGSYEEHLAALQFPNTAKEGVRERAAYFAFKQIDAQWIKNATAQQARDSFFRINQGGTKIESVEIRILKSKNSALAISARAISRGGTGHNYWDRFERDTQEEIQNLARELQRLLFSPELQQPIKTLDIPLAGYGYGSHVLPFAFDLVARANKLAVADSTGRTRKEKIDDDPDGSMTVSYLNAARKIVRFICSNDASSLGLHPALYFYNDAGAFQPAALFNLVDWLYGLQQRGKITGFLKVRAGFERLILDHPAVIRPPSHALGSGRRTRLKSISLFDTIFEWLLSGKTPCSVWNDITAQAEYYFLRSEDQEQQQALSAGRPGKPFNAKAKSAGFFA
jgi:hypothetical protein